MQREPIKADEPIEDFIERSNKHLEEVRKAEESLRKIRKRIEAYLQGRLR